MLKPSLTWLCLSAVALVSYAQSPSIVIKKDSSILGISDLTIHVQIVGNQATTTMDMNFHNNLDRVLEGELNFPLAERQTISRFAMDVLGEIREGVVVEKAKGRRAFETIIRRKVDPGLLEMTKGNNFKSRVYPIPAKGYKRLIVAYEQTLTYKNDQLTYTLPLDFPAKVKNFNLKIDLAYQSDAPISNNKWLRFKRKKKIYTAKYQAKDYLPNQSITITLPQKAENTAIAINEYKGKTYFYLNTEVSPLTIDKPLPKKIGLLWDVSTSAKKRQLKKELAVLESYFKTLKNVAVTLVTFSNDIHSTTVFNIEDGDCTALKQVLKNLQYDGGTQLGKLALNAFQVDEFILSSDGISNFGAAYIQTSPAPIYLLNSYFSANISYLKYLALQTGGKYLDLNTLTIKETLLQLKTANYQFIKATYKDKKINDTYPKLPTTIQDRFSLSGILKANKAKITLHFGIGNKVYHKKTIALRQNTTTPYPIHRIWANQQLAELDLQPKRNKSAITTLGKDFSLVTRYTSLIVLETINQYLEYEIVPPKPLQAEYFERLAAWQTKKEEERTYNKTYLLKSIVKDFQKRVEWWNKPINIKQKKPTGTGSSFKKTQSQRSIKPPFEPSNTQRSIKGTVTSAETGEALIGVNILVKNTTIGTHTDFEGNYKLSIPDDATTLIFSYTGFTTKEIPLDTATTINVQLSEGINLESIVVTGYGIPKETNAIAYNPISISKESTIQYTSNNLSSIPITQQNFNFTHLLDSSNIIDTNKQVLFIIDGKPAFTPNLDAIFDRRLYKYEQIKGAIAATIYGNKAANGVIIIHTEEDETDIEYKAADFKKLGLKFNSWTTNMPYLDSLKQSKNLYPTYLRLKKQFPNNPAFFLDIAEYFIQKNKLKYALQILSNISELELENIELVRIVARRLQQLNYLKEAIAMFEEIKELKEEEPQSYRDLALAYEDVGQYQKAVDLLHKVVTTEWDDRFENINDIALYEMNNIIGRHKKALNVSKIDSSLIQHLPVDLRIMLDWTSDNTDVDLWVTDPQGEKCYYKNKNTKIGGRLLVDLTEGYGPEEFILKKAIKGKYKIQADLYDDIRQNLGGAITIQVQIFKYYGTDKQEKEQMTLRFPIVEDEKKDTIVDIGDFEVK